MELTRKKCRYGCFINQVALFSTHGALYGNIPEGRWAEPQLQPPKRSQFMACSLFPLSFISLTAPFSSSKQPFSAQSGSSQAEKIHDRHVWQCLCLPSPPPFGVWGWVASSGPGSYGRAWAGASGGARATAWATSVGSNKCIGRCHSLQLLRRA